VKKDYQTDDEIAAWIAGRGVDVTVNYQQLFEATIFLVFLNARLRSIAT
jgi:hypothetical protein